MSNVFAAIQNRDSGALARMMGPDNQHDQQENVVNMSAEPSRRCSVQTA